MKRFALEAIHAYMFNYNKSQKSMKADCDTITVFEYKQKAHTICYDVNNNILYLCILKLNYFLYITDIGSMKKTVSAVFNLLNKNISFYLREFFWQTSYQNKRKNTMLRTNNG